MHVVGRISVEMGNGVLSIHDRQLIFPNASYSGSGGKLRTGDTSKLRDTDGNVRIFKPGENVGFFVIADGYNGSGVTGWVDGNPTYPSVNPKDNLGPAKGTMTSLDEINPENAANRSDVNRHIAMILNKGISGFMDGSDFLIVGMEDIRRNANSDNDFNDCVFIVSADPITAIATSEIIVYDVQNPDSDLDGVPDINDAWPTDPSRSYTIRTPAQGYSTLVFEDLYPSVGDADYNDLVVSYFHEMVMTGSGEVKEFQGTYHFTARGSQLDHAFGMAFPEIPSNTKGNVALQRFNADGVTGSIISKTLSSYGISKQSGGTMIRIADVCESTIQQLPGLISNFANTQRPLPEQNTASSRVVITFDTPQKPSLLSQINCDPFLYVDNGYARIDIHLPGREGFIDRPKTLPLESGPNSFLSAQGWPWVMEVPVDFRYPLEGVAVGGANVTVPAYDDFEPWVKSKGTEKADWYKRPKEIEGKNIVTKQAPSGRERSWTVGR
jgi:LruC domain-containing protein